MPRKIHTHLEKGRLAFNSATSQRGHGPAVLVSHPAPDVIPQFLSDAAAV